MPTVPPLNKYTPPAGPLPASSSTKKTLLIASVIFCFLAIGIFIYKNIEVTKTNPDSTPEEEIKDLIRRKDYTKVLKLVEENPNINIHECLDFALLFENDAIANIFAEKISNIDKYLNINPAHNSPLASAIEKKFDKTAYTLIQKGFNTAINGVYSKDRPLIHIAIEKRLPKTLPELIKDPNLHNCTYKDQSPLEYAIRTSNDDVAAALVSAGANSNPTKPRSTPLIHLALDKKLLKTVSALGKNPIHRDVVDKLNQTPLKRAVTTSLDETAAALINSGADCSGNFGGIHDPKSIYRVARDNSMQMPLTKAALIQNKVPMPIEDYFYFNETNLIDVKKLSQEEKNTCLKCSLNEEMFSLAIETMNEGADQKTPEKPPIFVAIEKDNKELFDACLKNNFDPSMTFLKAESASDAFALLGVTKKKAYNPLEYANHYNRNSFADRLKVS